MKSSATYSMFQLCGGYSVLSYLREKVYDVSLHILWVGNIPPVPGQWYPIGDQRHKSTALEVSEVLVRAVNDIFHGKYGSKY
jgi:hypothetical protein